MNWGGSMKVNVLNRKLIKPCSQTPENLRTYNLSLHDELSSPIDCAVVLYFQSAVSDIDKNFARLEDSLAKVLPHFYPFAGRYIKKDRLLDCNDQGIELVEAEVSDNIRLIDVVEVQDPPNDLLPRQGIVIENDIGSYPLLSVQLTKFLSGGIAIGVSLSHRIADTYSLATFISFWAKASHCNDPLPSLPSFDTPKMFPGKNPSVSVDHIPETMDGFVSKRFLFKKKAIIALKQGIPDARSASKVRLVCAVLARALIRADRAKSGAPSIAYIIGHSLNLRGKIMNPPLREHSCGNLAASALVPLIASEDVEKLGIEELVHLQKDAICKAIADYSDALAQGVAGHSIFVDELVYLNETTAGGDVQVLWFSDMTRFGFYEADFGWGKAVWTSFGTVPLENLVVLLADKEGNGIEAWVHLDPESMALFQQDHELIKIASQ